MNFLKTEYDSEPDDSLEKSMSLVASAISDPSRVSILCALRDGRGVDGDRTQRGGRHR
ncbi:hypothetical protein RABR111495_11135 [Rahnella bruchi]|jgi:DNA-binding transcriptional ArsR family regulator|uniref:hypothetical protein n=1 Tax=Rahnella bruchi TaxID=1510573 RepID=UPI0039F12064